VALGAAAGVAVENARLYDAARRQQRWIQASAEVTTRLLSGSAPAAVLADITRPTLELSGADLAVLALPDEEGRRLTITYAEGDGADAARGLVLPAGESLSGQVLSSGEPVTSAEFAADERVAASARMALRQAQRAAEPGQPRRQARRRTPARRGRPGRLPARDQAGMARPPRLTRLPQVSDPRTFLSCGRLDEESELAPGVSQLVPDRRVRDPGDDLLGLRGGVVAPYRGRASVSIA